MYQLVKCGFFQFSRTEWNTSNCRLVSYSLQLLAFLITFLDLDECLLGSHNCDVNGKCTNTEGLYLCTCVSGYTGNGTHCQDINECDLEMRNRCDNNAECKNTPGSFQCSCFPGYTGTGERDGCVDVDECLHRIHYCTTSLVCRNTNGSFVCDCLDGFMKAWTLESELDFVCEGMLTNDRELFWLCVVENLGVKRRKSSTSRWSWKQARQSRSPQSNTNRGRRLSYLTMGSVSNTTGGGGGGQKSIFGHLLVFT